MKLALFHNAAINGFFKYVFEHISLQKDNLHLGSLICFALGIILYFGLRVEPPPFLIYGPVFFFLCLFIALKPLLGNVSERTFLKFIIGAILFFGLGFLASHLRTHILNTTILAEKIGPVQIEGTIKSVEHLEANSGKRLILEKLDIERLKANQTPELIRLTTRDKDTAYKPGDVVAALAELNPPSPPVSPNAFDFQRYAYFKKLGAFGFSYRSPEIIKEADQKFYSKLWDTLRNDIATKVNAVLDERNASIAITMMTGNRAAIAEDDTEALRKAGLAHLLAISGLHVGLISSTIFFFLRLLMAMHPGFALKHPIKKYAAIGAFIGALFYAFAVGATIPTIRALIMVGIVLLAILTDRIAVSVRSLVLAGFFILIIWPEALLGASFQMSFAAVAGLVVFYQALRPYNALLYRNAGIVRKLALYGAGICATTIIATIATAPFALYHFQHLAVFGLPANLIAVPLMSFVVMPSIILSYVLMPFGLEAYALKIMGVGTDLILSVAHETASLSFASINAPAMATAVFCCLVAGGLWLLFWKGSWNWKGATLCFLMATIISMNTNQPDLLISPKSDLIALKAEDGSIHLSSRVKDRFIASSWLQRGGQDDAEKYKWPREGTANLGQETKITCDEWGCHILAQDRKVAISFHESTHEFDCDWADIIVTQQPLKQASCKASIAIDRYDTWRDGAHAVWFDKYYQNVGKARGKRPWTISND